MHKTMIVAALCVAIVTCAGTAQAGFINQTQMTAIEPAKMEAKEKGGKAEEKAQAPVITPSKRIVNEIGVRPKNMPIPRGRGQDISFVEVLPVVVPADFKVEMGNVNRYQRVNWSGGAEWNTVFERVVGQLDSVESTIDWNRKIISLNSTAAPPPAPMNWAVRISDVTLRQALERWGREASPPWQVSWEVKVNFPVQLEAAFSGSFESAVEQFMDSLKGSDHPLLGCLYEGNHVVRVLHYGDKKGCDK